MKSYLNIISIFLIAVFFNCGSDNTVFFKELLSGNNAESDNAAKKLHEIKFGKKDLPLIYKAIMTGQENNENYQLKNALIKILWKVNDPSTPEFIKKIYPSLPDNKDILFSALRTLSDINTEKSVKIFLDLILEYHPDLDYNKYFIFVPFYGNTGNHKYLFPGLYKLLEYDNYKYDIYCLIAHYRDNGLLNDKDILSIKDNCLKDYALYKKQRSALDSDEEKYDQCLKILEVLPDIMGSFGNDPKIKEILHELLEDQYPRIALFALFSLIKNGIQIDQKYINKTASMPETRLMLYEFLEKKNKKSLFPEKYLTQFYFAEADMVRWLCFPTEFGKAPDKIELVDMKDIIKGKFKGRYFLFKYIYNDTPDGWMTGISGPYPLDNGLTNGGNRTFSHFYKSDEMSNEEHFNTFLK